MKKSKVNEAWYHYRTSRHFCGSCWETFSKYIKHEGTKFLIKKFELMEETNNGHKLSSKDFIKRLVKEMKTK